MHFCICVRWKAAPATVIVSAGSLGAQPFWKRSKHCWYSGPRFSGAGVTQAHTGRLVIGCAGTCHVLCHWMVSAACCSCAALSAPSLANTPTTCLRAAEAARNGHPCVQVCLTRATRDCNQHTLHVRGELWYISSKLQRLSPQKAKLGSGLRNMKRWASLALPEATLTVMQETVWCSLAPTHSQRTGGYLPLFSRGCCALETPC